MLSNYNIVECIVFIAILAKDDMVENLNIFVKPLFWEYNNLNVIFIYFLPNNRYLILFEIYV